MWNERLKSVLSGLSSREREIINRRYALDVSKSKPRASVKGQELFIQGETLAAIGEAFGITRERVRQLENSIIGKIKIAATGANEEFASLEEQALTALREAGGALEENLFFEKLIGLHLESFVHWTPKDFCERQSASFLLEHVRNAALERVSPSEKCYSLWKEKKLDFQEFALNLEKIVADLRGIKAPLSEGSFLAMVRKNLNLPQSINDEIIKEWLLMIRAIRKNVLGLWGLTEWSQIVPKRIGDKINIIFEREKKPLHFREITSLINQLQIDKKIASEGSVRNELIASSTYVLIGRGIYAMENWGYRPGTVRETIERIMKEVRRPLSKEEIMGKVLKERLVKETTVHAVLSNKLWFSKLQGGGYTLPG
jgi:hypothetical protein